MKLFANRTLISLVVLVAFAVAVLMAPHADALIQSTKSQKAKIKPQKREKLQLRRAGKDYKVKKGAEIAAKVKRLKDSNRNVRAALKLFEDKKHIPKIDQSFAISGAYAPLKSGANNTRGLVQRVSFHPQSLIRGDYIDIIFVPVLSLEMEWQGTVIADLYDTSNNLVDEYVADSVLIMPEPNLYAWDEIYEAPVYDGFVGAPINEPGMYTNIDLGVPLDQQRFFSGAYQAGPPRLIQRVAASNLQGGQARIRAWANCTFGWCGAAGVNCLGSAAWNADVLSSSCFASGCGDDAIGCTWGTIWQ